MEIGSLTLIYIIKKKKEGFNLYFFPESWRQLITQLSWTHLFDSCFISSEKKFLQFKLISSSTCLVKFHTPLGAISVQKTTHSSASVTITIVMFICIRHLIQICEFPLNKIYIMDIIYVFIYPVISIAVSVCWAFYILILK